MPETRKYPRSTQQSRAKKTDEYGHLQPQAPDCLLYTSDAADEGLAV